MSLDAWITLSIAVATLVLMAADRYNPALVMGGAVTVLLVLGVIDAEQALGGFANEAPITVAALYVLAGAAEATGALDGVTARVFGSVPAGETRPERRILVRVTLPWMAASAFIANTPLVSMLAPRLLAWCRQTGRKPSWYLMPLSYAVIFGGCITVIGTSTNLVVSGLMRQNGLAPLELFEITPAGLPIAVVGTLLIVLLAPRLLRLREGVERARGQVKEFTIEMVVADGGVLVGRSIAAAGLRNLQGVFLVGVERDGEMIAPAGPEEVLRAKDRLIFAGNVTRIVDLQRMAGLTSAADRHFGASNRRFYEAVVGAGSDLAGTTLKTAQFRRRFGAAVVAIHRAGERVEGKLGDVRLRAGDVLLMVGGDEIPSALRDGADLHLLVGSPKPRPVRREKARIVQALALGLIVAAGTGLLDLMQASMLVAILLVSFGVLSAADARRSIDLEVILLMAASFGLGMAIGDTGLADQIARGIVAAFEPLGDVGVLGGILVATMLLTELLSNNAAAVLMFPIAMATAAKTGIDPRPVAVAVLFGASLSFLTPIGYQANTLIWGLGAYRYRDFSRLGAPLTLATAVAVLIFVPLVFPLR